MKSQCLRLALLLAVAAIAHAGLPAQCFGQFVRSSAFPIERQRDALQSTVRILAQTPTGLGSGSGVVVDRNSASFLVATVDHVLEDAVAVEVQTFDGQSSQPVRSYDKVHTLVQNNAMDFALIRVEGRFSGKVLPLCPPGRFPQAGEHVLSVGCSGGRAPTCEVDLLLGHDTEHWAVAQSGTKGRSGGPLITESGFVLGCCCCGSGQTTFYNYSERIHDSLDKAGLASLYTPGRSSRSVASRQPSSSRPSSGQSPPSVARVVRVDSGRLPTGTPSTPSWIGQKTRRIEVHSSSGRISISTSSQEIEIGPAGIVIRKGGVVQRVER